MPALDGSMRELHYPLDRTVDMESVTPDESIDIITLENWNTVDPDEKQDIVINLSLNEYIALANSVDVGRDIAYGDNSINVWFVWVRMLKSMAICQSIIDCIETDADVRNTINSSVQGFPETEGQQTRWEQSVFDEIPSCDEDTTWGYVDALWTYINQQNVDLLEQLNEATNSAGQITTLLKIIPGMEQIPVIDLLEWVENLGEYNLDAYNASITTAIEDQIKCDLFCIAVANGCTITFEDTWDYFVMRFGGGDFPNLGATFLELVLFMVTGIYASDRIVFLWTLVQLGFAFIGSRFLNSTDVQAMAIQAQNGDPDDDWILLCDTCTDEYLITWDTLTPSFGTLTWFPSSSFTVINAQIPQSNEQGDPIPSLKSAYGNAGVNYGLSNWWQLTLPSDLTIVEVSFRFWFRFPGGNSDLIARDIQLYDAPETTQLEEGHDYGANASQQTWQTFTYTPVTPITGVRMLQGRIGRSTALGGTSYANAHGFIDNIRITFQ